MRHPAALIALVFLVGCTDLPATRHYSAVTPVIGRDTANVTAVDLVMAMTKVNMTRDEILDNGPAIRNALAMQGGAELRQNGDVIALFSVIEGSLYAVSVRGGSHVHRLGNCPSNC